MKIEFSNTTSYTKYHYGSITSDIGQQWSFTLIENYEGNTAEFEVVWPDGPPHNYKSLEKAIVNQFNQVEL